MGSAFAALEDDKLMLASALREAQARARSRRLAALARSRLPRRPAQAARSRRPLYRPCRPALQTAGREAKHQVAICIQHAKEQDVEMRGLRTRLAELESAPPAPRRRRDTHLRPSGTC